MLNYNPSAKIPIHTNHAWLTTPKSRFSDDEKRELISSVLFLGPNFNNFVNSFYKTFQERESTNFIASSSEEALVNILSSSLNLIITSLEQPGSLREFGPILVGRQPNFRRLLKNRELFLKSFIFAIVDTFKDNYNDRLGLLWYRAVSDFSSSINLIINN